jgi:hypothetical protein
VQFPLVSSPIAIIHPSSRWTEVTAGSGANASICHCGNELGIVDDLGVAQYNRSRLTARFGGRKA